MPLETLEQGVNIKGMVIEAPEKKPFVFNPEREITEDDWKAIRELAPDKLTIGAWISMLAPHRAVQFDNDDWLRGGFNREGWGTLELAPRIPKRYLEMFYYAHLISPTKYPLGYNKRFVDQAQEDVRYELASFRLTFGPTSEKTLSDFITWNARLKILSNGILGPLLMSEDEMTALKKYIAKRFAVEKKRAEGRLILGHGETSLAEIIFSLKIAYPELCEFPDEAANSLHDWFNGARKIQDWDAFLEYALTMYVLSAKEVKVVHGLPVFVIEQPSPAEESTPPPPTSLKF